MREQMTDLEIVTQMGSPDAKSVDDAIRCIYSRYYRYVANFLQRYALNDEDIKDIFQDSVIALLHQVRKPTFELSSRLSTYLTAIARNLAVNFWKKQRHRVPLDVLCDRPSLNVEALQLIENRESQALLTRAIQNLGEPCRRILKYFYFDRMRMAEICLRMNYANEQVARNRKSKCLKQLRASLVEKTTAE